MWAATITAALPALPQQILQRVPTQLAEGHAWQAAEDFELVLAPEAKWAKALTAALPGSVVIGELLAGPADEGIQAGGYRHFA